MTGQSDIAEGGQALGVAGAVGIKRSGLLELVALTLLLSGCASSPRSADEHGIYCHGTGRIYRPVLTCTTAAIPAPDVEAEARRLDPQPGLLTLFVVRRNWGDANERVQVTVAGAGSVDTVPASFFRARLRPGTVQVSLQWQGRRRNFQVQGRAGEVVFLRLEGASWLDRASFRWLLLDEQEARPDIERARLIADLPS